MLTTTGCYAAMFAIIAAVCATGCAGNGEGLDQNGQPIGSGSGAAGPITADLQSIQDNVFTPICSKCHIGASAPEGLQLDAAHAYNLLIDVPSAEEPALLRVKPGDPDDSYMVHKIEGLAGIEGGQMPLGETPLPQATIDAIRQWISDGAPNLPSAAAASRVFAVIDAAPSDSSIVDAPMRRIVVAFTHELDATLLNETTVILERVRQSAGEAQADTAERLVASAASAEHNPAVLLITPARPLDAGAYRVTLRGTGGGALADTEARTLTEDISWEFIVRAAR